VKHPEIVRPELDWFDGDWFDRDPCTDAERDPTWYAPELVERIRSAATEHEIASHGFSHIVAGDPGCSRETFDSELRAAVSAAATRGVTLRSLVHPRNRIGHVDVLVDHGIRAYRGRRPPAGRAATAWEQLVDRTVGSERTAVRPIREGEIWNLPATIMFDVDTRARTWPLWVRQVERRLAQAVARRSLFHLWFHPHNLRDHPDAFLGALQRVCRAAARHRSRGALDTVTMGALAEQLSSPVA
jgi:peptidoglycan/xylan/chitin deacetylase (PgdA/CDA1 family)